MLLLDRRKSIHRATGVALCRPNTRWAGGTSWISGRLREEDFPVLTHQAGQSQALAGSGARNRDSEAFPAGPAV